jgi:outer membrane receptor protein involved in Fe transport
MAGFLSLGFRRLRRRQILDSHARIAVVAAALLAGGATDLAAQAGTIRGRVVHSDQPIGLTGVELTLSPSGATTRTDPGGNFVFHGVTPGHVELSAHGAGFVTAMVALDVRAAAATEVEIRLEPVVAVLDPIVTSATRLDPRRMAGVARTVSVTDSSAIQRGRMIGLHETLRAVPGVQAASRYGTDDVTIGIRGSAARSPQAVRGVVVLLDGIPLTEPDGVARLDLIELAAARQVEVIRGPASALYAGSPGGVVNVVSRSGRDSPGVLGRAQGGAFGFRKYDGRVGGVFAGGRGSAIAAASHTSTTGHRAHSEAEILRGQAALDYVAGAGTRVSFQAVGSRLDSSLPGPLSQQEFEADPAAAAPATIASVSGAGWNRPLGAASPTRTRFTVAAPSSSPSHHRSWTPTSTGSRWAVVSSRVGSDACRSMQRSASNTTVSQEPTDGGRTMLAPPVRCATTVVMMRRGSVPMSRSSGRPRARSPRRWGSGMTA